MAETKGWLNQAGCVASVSWRTGLVFPVRWVQEKCSGRATFLLQRRIMGFLAISVSLQVSLRHPTAPGNSEKSQRDSSFLVSAQALQHAHSMRAPDKPCWRLNRCTQLRSQTRTSRLSGGPVVLFNPIHRNPHLLLLGGLPANNRFDQPKRVPLRCHGV